MKELYYQSIVDLAEKWLEGSSRNIKNKQYLDIGCGAGLGSKEFGEHFHLETWGITTEPFRHKLNHPIRVEGEKKDIYASLDEFDDEYFTIISTVDFMEYVYYDLTQTHKITQTYFLKQLRRVLSDTGILLVSETLAYRDGIKSMLEYAGFKIIKEKVEKTRFSILVVKR